MSKFLSLSVNVLSYNSASATNAPQDLEQINNTIQESAVGGFTRYNPLIVPTGTTDQAIQLPAALVNYLIIFCDQVISISINGGPAITLRPLGTVKSPVYLTRGDITSFTVSNSSGVSANLDIIVAQV
jgi:hypothetical protein